MEIGTRSLVEIITRTLHPQTYHPLVAGRLYAQLFNAVRPHNLATVFFAPIDVQLSDHDIVQPDLCLIVSEREQMITPAKVKGSPDLIVEILSPGTRVNDQVLKMATKPRYITPSEIYQNLKPPTNSADEA